jgi:hypothetical protein
MKTLLTPPLLKFLTGKGYRYCLSKTSIIQKDNAEVCITLTPVTYKPALKRLPKQYDTYFSIRREPVQMASGVDDTLIMVDVNTQVLVSYINTLLSSLNLPNRYSL